MTRVLVTGDRHWDCRAIAERIVESLRLRHGADLVVVHGHAPGVDSAFRAACGRQGVFDEPHRAAWTILGKAAGPIRNAEMVAAGADFVIAVHRDLNRSKGTRGCVRLALDAGIPVWLVEDEYDGPNSVPARQIKSLPA